MRQFFYIFRLIFHSKQLSELYISAIMHSLAFSMVCIFVPLYFLNELKYSLDYIIFFYIVFTVTLALLVPFVGKFCSKFGVKHSILISVIFGVIYIGFLYLLENHSVLYFPTAMLIAAYTAFFWIGFHIDFAKFSHKKYRGQETSYRISSSILFSILGPFIGGSVITLFGFHVLFIIISLLLFSSAAILFFSKEIYVRKFSFSFRYIFRRNYYKDILGFIGHGMDLIALGIFWPLFMFFILRSYFSIGAIMSIALAFGSFMAILISVLYKKYSSKSILSFGSIVMAILWIVKIFVRTPLHILSISIADKLTYPFIDVPIHSMTYDRANKSKSRAEYIIFREIFLCTGRILCLLSVLIFGKIIYGFVAAGVGSLLMLLF